MLNKTELIVDMMAMAADLHIASEVMKLYNNYRYNEENSQHVIPYWFNFFAYTYIYTLVIHHFLAYMC